jgi:hypothetical protein
MSLSSPCINPRPGGGLGLSVRGNNTPLALSVVLTDLILVSLYLIYLLIFTLS